ncbi:hypothetical protein Gohar_011671, partial [Gossypium harknessii]|nr:hypothetical protein [Gossypium harknessii]
ALLQSLGDRKGINRFGDFSAPLDEALIHVSLDLSGRPHLSYDLNIPTARVGTYDTQLAGKNSHHIIEATFKAFARALRQATEYDPRRLGTIPSPNGNCLPRPGPPGQQLAQAPYISSCKGIIDDIRDNEFKKMLSMANINPGREGHLGIIVVKSAGDQSGLKDDIRFAECFEKEPHVAGPNKVDFDMRKRAVIENQRVVNSGQHRKVQLFNPVNNWSIDFYQKKTG